VLGGRTILAGLGAHERKIKGERERGREGGRYLDDFRVA